MATYDRTEAIIQHSRTQRRLSEVLDRIDELQPKVEKAQRYGQKQLREASDLFFKAAVGLADHRHDALFHASREEAFVETLKRMQSGEVPVHTALDEAERQVSALQADRGRMDALWAELRAAYQAKLDEKKPDQVTPPFARA